MGSTRWSDDHYAARTSARLMAKTPTFAYSDKVMSGAEPCMVHTSLDPSRKKLIESRDSAEHPESNAVAVICDVTGSMSVVPEIVQEQLPKLMGLLLRKGYLADPQILIGAVGDATCDKIPLQIGEFESGIEIEDCLTNLVLEGGGGGHITESYELPMYFMARHTAIDCLEKRGRRGYLFFIGDEIPYPAVNRVQVERLIGDKLQADVPTSEVVAELKRMYDCYFILPGQASNKGDRILKPWRGLFGQNIIELQDADGVCECIAGAIGVAEGVVLPSELADHLVDAGSSKAAAESVCRSLATVTGRSDRGTDVSLPVVDATGGGVATL